MHLKPIFTTMIKKHNAKKREFKTVADWNTFVSAQKDLTKKEKSAFSVVSENFDALSKMDGKDGLTFADFKQMDAYVGGYQTMVQDVLNSPNNAKLTPESIDDFDAEGHEYFLGSCDLNKIKTKIKTDDCNEIEIIRNLGIALLPRCRDKGSSIKEIGEELNLLKRGNEDNYFNALAKKFSKITGFDGEEKLTRFDLLMADLAAYEKS